MIQASDYFRQFSKSQEITDQIRKNADKLLAKVCTLLSLIPYDTKINSGGSVNSHHCFGNAIDVHDPDKIIANWCINNESYLKDVGLHIETPDVTCASDDPLRRWIHFQQVPPKSGKVIFIP